MGGLLGGSKSTSSSKSGYSALSKPLKAKFDPFAEAINQYALPSNAGVTEAFTPMGISGPEQSAINAINQGFTPNQASLTSDINMQMNPFNQFVIDEVNRQGGGEYSMLKQAMNEAGQTGSNRQLLGANDIDLSRMNQIGGFLGQQFNTSLGNAMNRMPALRAADAASQLGAGGMVRDLSQQQALAPISALQAGTGLMGPFVQGGTSTQTQKSGGGLGGLLGAGLMAFGGPLGGMMGSGLGAASSAMGGGGWIGNTFFGSDRRLKENINPVGQENGHNVYEFNYTGHGQKFVGVMADEVEKLVPDAVVEIGGYKHVDYGMIGVKFREAG